MNSKSNIYIVDDDELVLDTLKRVLLFAGYDVEVFDTANSVLETLKDTQEGCLIIDLRMPEMDGLELQQQLQQQNINLPVIFFSGAADVESAVKAMQKGAFTFLQKPVSNDLLLETIQTAITQHQQKYSSSLPAKTARQALNLLSRRELDVARLTSEGLSATEIADKLYISTRTVEAHKASAFTKLNIHNNAQLTRLVILADA